MSEPLPFDPTAPKQLPKPGPRKALSDQAPVGSVFGHWTVLAHMPARSGHRYLQCQCSCGAIKDVMGGHVVRGKSTNCGCKRPRDSNRTHGLSHTRTHAIWLNMLDRCQRTTRKDYPHYGGRGIAVCARWLDFATFVADMGEAPVGLSIERLDNDGDYCPSNCIWATRKVQARNKRNTVRITHNGRTMALGDWADEIGVAPLTIWKRLKRGWTTAKALNDVGGIANV